MSTSLDPRAVKEAQRATWDALSGGWADAREVFERGAAAVSGRLLDLGGVRPGQSVLDVGTGLGEPALSAARRVGRTGRVVATDISPRMLRIARRRAAALGPAAADVEFTEADVEAQGFGCCGSPGGAPPPSARPRRTSSSPRRTWRHRGSRPARSTWC
ncbi:SAM-dependent methyltransferase [Actinomadura logoneensis]|uniref:SAM-dependent methyltransferase n=1 Tax=Actinomadura logoneensis TaxID=2293572 RepID=UPI001F17B293|nr:methyltransferase domain-containing protein [Actinomadura logoneensis]